MFLALFIILVPANTLTFSQDTPEQSFSRKIVAAAKERTQHAVTYDGSYHSIPYPMGDVPDHIGVCTDVVIRSYRAVGIDFQQLVHEDMQEHFSQYPNHWGLKKPDPNIDHRRVPNLQIFFTRHGQVLPVTRHGSDYQAGDLVTWTVAGRLPHIGIVIDELVPDTDRPFIIHNIGEGPQKEDILFEFPITGHYRYEPTRTTPLASPTSPEIQ